MNKTYTVKPVYKGHSRKLCTLWTVVLNIQVKIICIIH